MEVKNYWVRIFILITYFILVFIVSRILDLVLWYHHGYLPNDLVDPIVLNVRQLKLLLDSRGISYTGVLEKQQLVELLNDSAHVVKSEVDELSIFSNNTERLNSHPPPSSLFTGGSHFNEKVEDTKDSVWLVQVMPASKKRHEPLLDDYSWRYLKHHLAPFAIQTGVFDCALDRELCIRRNWLEPILLLALPRGNRPKDHVIIRTSNTPKIHMIIKWVKEQLSIRVNKISSLSQLEDEWMSTTKSDDNVKVVLFSHLIHTPLFFAALSIKFTGRIKFGIFSLKKDEDSNNTPSIPQSSSSNSTSVRKYLSRHHKISTLPTYLIITPETKHVYGKLPAEHYNLFHMNLFLKLIVPEMNDVFIVALVLTNMLAVIDICQMQGCTGWLYLIRGGFLITTYNLFLFLLSLVLYNMSWPTLPVTHLISILRHLNCSPLGAMLRADLLCLYHHPVVFVMSFVLYGFLSRKIFRCHSAWYWDVFPLGNSFIVNSLFRPSDTAGPSRHLSSDVTFDLRFEQLVITRSPRVFNVPNLWLQASPRVDYISDLPVFEYRGWRPCPHKEMKLLVSVMDGEDPRCLGNRPESKRDVDSVSRHEDKRSSASISQTTTIHTTYSNVDTDTMSESEDTTHSTSFSVDTIPSRNHAAIHSISHRATHVHTTSSNVDTDTMSESEDTNHRPSPGVGNMRSSNRDTHGTSSAEAVQPISSNENDSHGVDNRNTHVDIGSDVCDYLECRLIRVQDCAICLESYELRTVLLALPCAHHFHKTCVLSWLRRGHSQCPVCRWPAYKHKYEFTY
ncbi:E3 ubiquitin-protein ligase RNF103 [Diaphorina citri]|uniref:E3 ubiquitin-protein ligase RNF103 n=1 Tax=Diaphorina citri TaxID=121845 RepID=A0A1S3DNE1_DIACI|nr:E3 ubiquitin-protein ligase RNF103 [Diaphorina citri]